MTTLATSGSCLSRPKCLCTEGDFRVTLSVDMDHYIKAEVRMLLDMYALSREVLCCGALY